ncbi:MAG: TadE family protein [Caldilineaceae bacterium]
MTRRMGAESGQDLVEYALVLPLFLLLMFSTIEFGFLFFQYTMVVNAAREGARAGIVVDTTTCGRSCLENRIKAAVRSKMTSVDPNKVQVTPLWPTVNYQPLVQVTVRYQTGFITGALIEEMGGNGSVTLASTATMQREY